MPREATVTRDEVHAVADKIAAEGGTPGARSVRMILQTGSMGTIHKHLQSWTGDKDRLAAPEPVVSPALQRALTEFQKGANEAARAPLEAEIASLQDSCGDLATENERQQQVIDDQASEIEALAGAKAAAEGKIEQLTADLQAARDGEVRERQAAEMARTEVAKLQLQIDAIPRIEEMLSVTRADLDKERGHREKAQQEAATTRQEAAVLGANKQALENQAKELMQRIDELKLQLAKAGEDLVNARDEKGASRLGRRRIVSLQPRKKTV